ncbi:hypothetical protein [Steroidobacter sp.]|uniref:hypothetical protein n=1 Tax=Steroidobacter sp. TaxID=1978227 RepID=UPI002EDAF172
MLLIGEGDHVAAALQLAHSLHRDVAANWQQLVLLGSETFSFRARPSTILVEGMPAGVIACAPSLEEWGIASRLASPSGLPGCYDGAVADLAIEWLASLRPPALNQLQIVVRASSINAALEAAAGRSGVPLLISPMLDGSSIALPPRR